MIIGILGIKRSGKDTTSDYLVSNYDFNKFTLADPVKEICKILFDFNDDQLYGNKKDLLDENWGTTPRKIFQYLGTDIFRNDIQKIIPDIGNNFWINLLINKYNKIIKLNKNIRIVISDIRFQNEIDKIHELGGKIIKIIRPSIENEDIHESEKPILDLRGDFEIINNGTLNDLYNNVDQIINAIKII